MTETEGNDTNLNHKEGDTFKSFLSKAKWRGKLFSKEEVSARETARKHQLAENVVEFLKPSTDRARKPVAPKIDIQAVHDWAEQKVAHNNQNYHAGFHRPSDEKRATRKNKNMRVTFVKTAPEIIGHGGDDTETPPTEVSRLREKVQASKPHTTCQPEAQADHEPPSSPSSIYSNADLSETRYKNANLLRPPVEAVQQALALEPDTSARSLLINQSSQAYNASKEERGPSRFTRTSTGFAWTGKLSNEGRSQDVANFAPSGEYVSPPRARVVLVGQEQPLVVPTLPAREVNNPSMSHTNTLDMRQKVAMTDPVPVAVETRQSVPHERTQRKAVPHPLLSIHNERSPRHNALAASSQALFDHRGSSSAPLSSDVQLHTSADEKLAVRLESLKVSPTLRPHSSHSSQSTPSDPTDVLSSSHAEITSSISYFLPSATMVGPNTSRVHPGTKVSQRQNEPTPASRPASGEVQQSVAEINGDVALCDFADRMAHLKQMFKLIAELERPSSGTAASEWARAGLWWFLKSRAMFEAVVPRQPRSVDSQSLARKEPQEMLQAHVDLAKALWITTEMLQQPATLDQHSGRGTLAVELRSTSEALLTHIKALVVSMYRNQLHPPHRSLAQGSDTTIWIKYPAFAPQVRSCLSGIAVSRPVLMNGEAFGVGPLQELPLGDSKDEFCYSHAFVSASVATEDRNTHRVPLPCSLTILRGRSDWHPNFRVTSQNGLVSIKVSSDEHKRPTWHEIQWHSKSDSVNITLPQGFALHVQLEKADFQMLRNTYDYMKQIEASLQPGQDEKLVHEATLKDFQQQDSAQPLAFAPQRPRRGKVRIFERIATTTEDTGERSSHRGYRLCVATSTKSKQLSSISHVFGTDRPMAFHSISQPDNETPVLELETTEEGRPFTLRMAFSHGNDLQRTLSVLNGMTVQSNETVVAELQLKGMSIEPLAHRDSFVRSVHDLLKALQWQYLRVIAEDPLDHRTTTGLAQRLRLVMGHTLGSVTDRIDIRPGELRLRLPVDASAELSILRGRQEDMNISMNAKDGKAGIPDALGQLLQAVAASSTIRNFTFQSLSDLHVFQKAITGFQVKYDGLAPTLTISRHRMILPLHKLWTAGPTRLQIVQQANITHLLAFFSDFSHGQCMSFQLKGHDVFEKVEKGGKHWIRFVEAKFALPSGRDGRDGRVEGTLGDDLDDDGAHSGGWVCLDTPDWPGECDDIMVGFESESERDRFAEALPAPARAPRALTLRRRI